MNHWTIKGGGMLQENFQPDKVVDPILEKSNSMRGQRSNCKMREEGEKRFY